jgi:hypothetical protein
MCESPSNAFSRGAADRRTFLKVLGAGGTALTFSSAVGLAVSEFARQNKVMFLAAEPLTEALT